MPAPIMAVPIFNADHQYFKEFGMGHLYIFKCYLWFCLPSTVVSAGDMLIHQNSWVPECQLLGYGYDNLFQIILMSSEFSRTKNDR